MKTPFDSKSLMVKSTKHVYVIKAGKAIDRMNIGVENGITIGCIDSFISIFNPFFWYTFLEIMDWEYTKYLKVVVS